MDQELSSIIGGAPFFTARSVARVVKRIPDRGSNGGDVLLLTVAPSSTRPAYEAWTTVPALALALETGGWSACPTGGSQPPLS